MPAFAGMTSFVVRGDGKRYGVVTLHRPSNVDSIEMMARIGGALKEIAAELPLIFPVHPRTRGNLEKFGIDPGPNCSLARRALVRHCRDGGNPPT